MRFTRHAMFLAALEPDATALFPACCFCSDTPTAGELLYVAYNLAGDRPGLNYRGEPCPTWADLPADIRQKWEFVGDLAREEFGGHPC